MRVVGLSTAFVESELAKYDDKINELKTEIDSIMSELAKKSSNKLNMNLFSNHPSSSIGDGFVNENEYVLNGTAYVLVNSRLMTIMDLYNEFVQNPDRKFYQTADVRYDSSCLQLADAYGRRLYYGDFDIKGIEKLRTNFYEMQQFMANSTAYWNDHFVHIPRSENDNAQLHEDAKNELLEIMYDEVKNNRPCVVQVDVKRSDGTTSRHYALCLGLNKDAQDKNDLTEEDFLILDPWDGEFSQLGNHRDMYAGYSDGYYSYRVQTLKTEEDLVNEINKQRRENGWKTTISGLTYKDL